LRGVEASKPRKETETVLLSTTHTRRKEGPPDKKNEGAENNQIPGSFQKNQLSDSSCQNRKEEGYDGRKRRDWRWEKRLIPPERLREF